MVDNARSALALLRVNGGRSVLLRLPMPPTAGDESEGLGLATPSFIDVVLEPVVVRGRKLLVAAQTVAAAAGTLAFDGADTLFRNAAAIVIDGSSFSIAAVTTEEAFGAAYCYALTLRAPGN